MCAMRILKVGRDACTGRFISQKAARERPSTTVVETYKIPIKRVVKRSSRG